MTYRITPGILLFLCFLIPSQLFPQNDADYYYNIAEAARLQHKIATSGYFPEVVMVSSAESNGEEFDIMHESWNIGIQLQWDLYDGGLTRAEKANAKSEMKTAQAILAKLKKELAGNIEKIKTTDQSLEQRIKIQKESIEMSKKNYNDARSLYRLGTLTLTRLGEFSLNYAETRFGLLILYYNKRELLNKAESLFE